MQASAPHPEVKTVADLGGAGAEYFEAVAKLVASHAVNELYGAQVFDEPAIALAPTPYTKYLSCRIAMEEYHHHVRFKGLADEMGLPSERYDPTRKKPLSIFEFPLATWEQFCVIKAFADLAEILQVEDLLHCSFVPLRNIARITMPEEKFHAQFGFDSCRELASTPEGKARVQAAIDEYFPYLPKFFGAPNSRNNELFRACGLKKRRNEEMVADFLARSQRIAEQLGVTLPPVEPPQAAAAAKVLG